MTNNIEELYEENKYILVGFNLGRLADEKWGHEYVPPDCCVSGHNEPDKIADMIVSKIEKDRYGWEFTIIKDGRMVPIFENNDDEFVSDLTEIADLVNKRINEKRK